jgi:hypothetical protein
VDVYSLIRSANWTPVSLVESARGARPARWSWAQAFAAPPPGWQDRTGAD